MSCPNVNLDSWKNLVTARGESVAYALWDMYDGVVPQEEYVSSIKEGVKELFDSNPELANAVYEALGVKINKDVILEEKEKSGLFATNYNILLKGKVVGNVIVGRNWDNKTQKETNVIEVSNIHINEDVQQQNIANTIYTKLVPSLYPNKTISSYKSAQLSPAITKIWNNLVSKGFATENNGRYETNGDIEQQAQQLYSAYLDSIFPDSKVKDIVYHGANEPIEGDKFAVRPGATGNAIWFSGSKRYATNVMNRAPQPESLSGRKLRGDATMYSVLLNIKNPAYFYESSGAILAQSPERFLEGQIEPHRLHGNKQYDKNANDGALFHHPNSKKPKTNDSAEQVVVFQPEKIHRLGSKKDIAGFKEFVVKVPESESRESIVKYGLKATNVLQSEKGIKLFNTLQKNKVTGDTFWNKVQNDLQIPKEQIEILKQYGTTDREQLITNMLADYSYTVEINTAKSIFNEKDMNETFEDDLGNIYFKDISVGMPDNFIKIPINSDYSEIKITEKEFNEVSKKFANLKNTQIHSNLTVPGGTNYTENAIRTVGIINYISNNGGYHDREFNESRGDMAGWFRSDDKYNKEQGDLVIYYKENTPKDVKELYDNLNSHKITNKEFADKREDFYVNKGIDINEYQTTAKEEFKTRRILEVQSFFQKSRDKDFIVKGELKNEIHKKVLDIFKYNAAKKGQKFKAGNIWFQIIDIPTKNNYTVKNLSNGKTSIISRNNLISSYEKYNSSKQTVNDNQFLQLLNKDNNWITFFVKSIIQDSAKKGYEKVLFPSGATITKIEKFDKVQEKIAEYNIKIEIASNAEIKQSIKEPEFYILGDIKYRMNMQHDVSPEHKTFKFKSIEAAKKEKDNIIKNLEEERQHYLDAQKDTLSTINFYENTVTNILNKTYSKENVKVITDEYGNTWNEVQLESTRDKEEIFFQKEKTRSTAEVNKELNDKIERFLEKIGVSIQSVSQIRDKNGDLVKDAVARASMLNKIIQVIEGKASIDTLPEEAAHFFVKLLGKGNPLYKEMYNKITNYDVYRQTLEEYKKDKGYKNPDGTVNFDKIKEEAMGKLIAQHIIRMEPGSETEARLVGAITWWQKLWEYIKSIFNTADENPFEDAATKILMGETEDLTEQVIEDEEYYQLVNPLEGLMQDQDKITLDNSIDARTSQKRHIYQYQGVQAKGSVTSIYVDKWLKKIFKTDNRSDVQKIIDLAKAEFGDIVHEQIQDIIKSWTDSDGTKKATQNTIKPKVNPVIYKKLNNFIQSIMEQYEDGTIFKSEVKIFDKKTQIAGSIDLLVVIPDGTVEVYDWKTQQIFKDQFDIKTYKEPMYRIQLENYRKILQFQYGFEKFGRIRAIPIATTFDVKNRMITSLINIEIGSLNPLDIPEDKNYLLPVTLRTETTGDQRLDNVIEKLYGVYDKIDKQRYTKEEVFKKREELEQLRLAIRDLQLRGQIDKLIDLGLVEYKKYQDLVTNKTLTGKDIPEALSILKVFGSDSGLTLYDIRQELRAAVEESGDPKALASFNAIDTKLLLMSQRINTLIKDIEQYRDQQAKALGEKEGIFNLLDPEKAIGTIKGLFSSLSNITQKSFRVFSKLLRRVQNIRDAKFDATAAKLGTLKDSFVKFANGRGLTTAKAMDMILQLDKKGNWNGNFLNEFKEEFDTGKKEAIETSDAEWLLENLEYDEEKYKKAEKKQMEIFKSIGYASEEEENTAKIEKKIKQWIDSHRVVNSDGTINKKALFNEKNRFLTAVNKWQTDKWKDLNKLENKPVKDVYDYFRSLVRDSEELGMLDKYSPHFIPSTMANKMDQLVFGDVKSLFSGKGFFENLEVDSGSKYTPEIDPTNGQVINRIPVYFTKDMGVEKEDGTIDYSKKSRDLFKVFGIWAAHMYNYEAMDSIEDDAMMLVETEKNKKRLLTDNFSNIIIENGHAKPVEENERNSKLLADFVNYYIYDKVNGKFNDTSIKVLGKEYSALKTFQSALRFFSLKTLALNPISGTANFVGGTGNALFQAEKGILFTKKTWARGIQLATGDKKAKAALVYFNILQEGRQNQLINHLSLSSTNQILNADNAYIIQRTSDKMVQYPVGVAMMLNSMVENGEIVDIQQFVKNKYDYNNSFYNLSKSEQKAMRNKIDKEVEQLQDTRSILKIGELNDKGEFSIPGISREGDTFGQFRDKMKAVSKKILGNNSRDDINAIRTTMLGSALMQFRNWMPEMVEDRFSGLQYDDELGVWTYGKLTQFFGEILGGRGLRLAKAIATGFGGDAIQLAKDSYERVKRNAYEKGEEFTITEGEYIDMYLGNLKSSVLELTTVLGFAALVFSIIGAGSGDDDDDKTKGMKKYLARAMRKYYSEFAFYYNPIEFTRLLKSPLPVVGLAEDFVRFTTNFSKEIAGQAIGNKDWTKSAKPMKYFTKMVPVAKEAMLVMAVFDDDFRKDWDIRIQPGF